MKKELKFNVTLNNRTLYSFIALGIFILISVTVFAFGTSSPTTLGHSAGELDLSAGVNGDALFNDDIESLGNIKAPLFCIGANCISYWPSGGEGGSSGI